MINIAAVRIGTKYPPQYVSKLFSMLRRHLPTAHPDSRLIHYRFILITDQPERFPGVETINIWNHMHRMKLHDVNGWWGKMFLFNRDLVGQDPILYFDLDTVIIDDLTPLIKAIWQRQFFATCENFTKLAGNTEWPCNYGSCMMFIPEGFGHFVWDTFQRDTHGLIQQNPRGDQQLIEKLVPNAMYFQDICPPGYIVGRRDFTTARPKDAAIMIFAGNHKPHNTPIQWLREAWQ